MPHFERFTPMNTTKFLAVLFGCLLVLSGIAAIWRPNRDLHGQQIAAFNEKHPDLLLQLDYGNSGAQKIILQSSSGVGPDILKTLLRRNLERNPVLKKLYLEQFGEAACKNL